MTTEIQDQEISDLLVEKGYGHNARLIVVDSNDGNIIDLKARIDHKELVDRIEGLESILEGMIYEIARHGTGLSFALRHNPKLGTRLKIQVYTDEVVGYIDEALRKAEAKSDSG